MDGNTNSDGWSINIREEEAAIPCASSAESHCPEPLTPDVYQACSNTSCSTLDPFASMTAVRQTGLHTP
jgi:hypothetical protein